MLSGRLHVYVAFDWGDEIDLDQARRQGAGVVLDMTAPAAHARPASPTARRRCASPWARWPSPCPALAGTPIRSAEATVFDFAGVSLALQLPFSLPRGELRDLASRLAEPPTALADHADRPRRAGAALPSAAARHQPAGLARQLLGGIFRLPVPARARRSSPMRCCRRTPAGWPGWCAWRTSRSASRRSPRRCGWCCATAPTTCSSPTGPRPCWSIASGECDETLQAIEFANLQLLEFRNIDDRLDGVLGQADDLLGRASRSRLPAWRGFDRPLRVLGELKVEANGLFERTGNALKLVGDQYLARVYRPAGLALPPAASGSRTSSASST